VAKLWEILCGQKFTKQAHQEYLHYEYSKFRLGFEFLKVMRFDLTRHDMIWCVLMCFDAFRRVLTCFDWCPEELWKNVTQYEFRPKGRKYVKCPKVHSTNTSKIPALWIPKVRIRFWVSESISWISMETCCAIQTQAERKFYVDKSFEFVKAFMNVPA